MQQVYPEGYYFTNVIYGLCWTSYLERFPDDTTALQTAFTEILKSMKKLDSDYSKGRFVKNTQPPYGIFYSGWKLYFQTEILAVSKNLNIRSGQEKSYTEAAKELQTVLDTIKILPSTYPGLCWPADVFPALNALKYYGENYDSSALFTVTNMLNKLKKSCINKSGLFPHQIGCVSGLPRSTARGSSTAMILRFLKEIDSELADELYNKFKEDFTTELFGLPFIREYPVNVSGEGDADSGPLFLGAGGAATIMGPGIMKLYGDSSSAIQLENVIEAIGFPIVTKHEKSYLLGSVPMMDLFFLWSKLAPEGKPLDKTENSGNWRWTFHIFSFILLLIIIWINIRIFFLKKKKNL